MRLSRASLMVLATLVAGVGCGSDAKEASNGVESIPPEHVLEDRKSTRLNSSHSQISYAVFCLKKKINHYRVIPDALERADAIEPLECRRYVEEKFAPDCMVTDYEKAYEGLL